MKKVISILLVLVIALSLCACSNKVNIKESVIGTWELNEVLPSYWGGTYVETTILEIYQGGTGKLRVLVDGDASRGSTNSATWEIKDGVLNFSVATFNTTNGYIYDADSDTLKSVDNTMVYTRKNP